MNYQPTRVVTIIMVGIIYLLVSGCGDATTTATTTSASPQSATSAPKPTLTPKPSPTLNTTQTPLYGGDLRDFQAKYGKGEDISTPTTVWERYHVRNILLHGSRIDITAGVTNNRVWPIYLEPDLGNFPNDPTNTPIVWSEQQAFQICSTFLPRDAQFLYKDTDSSDSNAPRWYYHSDMLANEIGNDGQVHIEAVIFTVSDTEKDIVGCSMSSN